ncbi:hypothetical protein FE783_15140 [Paenibacillus mesophilus]|uniref:hypothetical protein n=1 Tax=Paenibacillus mesophilus TaxID=2582849 RepID=UPI00110F4C32|nr:hypothetical protein [Paenibacillus mesophilus]TMV49005.1 hypothetical protein FE783_15140 [Paenibacillus mesophilus]
MTFRERQHEVAVRIALAAYEQPLLESGLWFHHDIRDNFYYASHLFATSTNPGLSATFDTDEGKQIAETVLLEVIRLQDQDTRSDTYGHFPLKLEPQPAPIKRSALPIELMGILMAYLFRRYSSAFSRPLRLAFESALLHAYRSGYYRKPLNQYNHHEAKYTAAKLIFGEMFHDRELLRDGQECLERMIASIQTKGMSEYGSLPWFWHWVQAFTCAWSMTENAALKQSLAAMLDRLWQERSQFYLQGTWVGAHSRALKHDIPRDSNVLFDYVQYGDFALPRELPRTEYAGLLFYEASEPVRRAALERSQAVEVTKLITKQATAARPEAVELHSYAYITESFAAGGVWERYAEFDNEQHRWDFTLPLGLTDGVNQSFFMHPGSGYAEDDPRHQSDCAEVLLHKNTVLALYPIPPESHETIVGILPKGEWLQEPNALYGQAGNVYWAIYVMRSYHVEEKSDRMLAISVGSPNGVVMEAVSVREAARKGMRSLNEFAGSARARAPQFSETVPLSVTYSNLYGEKLELVVHPDRRAEAFVGETLVSFEGYTV